MRRADLDGLPGMLFEQFPEQDLLRVVVERHRDGGERRAVPLGALTHDPDAKPQRCDSQARRTGLYVTMNTGVPIGTSGYNASESEMYIRMHPCDA